MPLELTDERWDELNSSYDGTENVVEWLSEAYETGRLTEQRLGDLINEVQHQGDTSTAMYAVAAHLVALAGRAAPEESLTLLTHAGIIYSSSTAPGAVRCPAFLMDEFSATAPIAAAMIAPLLPLAKDFESYKWAVAALAGFLGQHQFSRFLEGLELYQGRFHHDLLEEPFPEEEE